MDYCSRTIYAMGEILARMHWVSRDVGWVVGVLRRCWGCKETLLGVDEEARVLTRLYYIQTITKRNNYWEGDWEGGVGADLLKFVGTHI